MTNIKIVLCLFLVVISSLAQASSSYQYPCKSRSEACTTEYEPVCAFENLVCIRAPCNQYFTYPNACSACKNIYVEGYNLGECPERDGEGPYS